MQATIGRAGSVPTAAVGGHERPVGTQEMLQSCTVRELQSICRSVPVPVSNLELGQAMEQGLVRRTFWAAAALGSLPVPAVLQPRHCLLVFLSTVFIALVVWQAGSHCFVERLVRRSPGRAYRLLLLAACFQHIRNAAASNLIPESVAAARRARCLGGCRTRLLRA